MGSGGPWSVARDERSEGVEALRFPKLFYATSDGTMSGGSRYGESVIALGVAVAGLAMPGNLLSIARLTRS